MAQGGPIDGCDPTAFLLIEVNDALRAEFVRPALLIGVIHVKRQDQIFPQLDALLSKVLLGARAGQSKPVEVVQVLKVGINFGGSHRSAPIPSWRKRGRISFRK